jgi:hypothetical protein
MKKIPMTEAEKKEFLEVRGQPTDLDKTQAEAHRAKLAAYARCNAATVAHIAKQRAAEAKLPNDQTRRENACLGLERFVKKLTRENDGRAARVEQFRAAAVEELHSYIGMTEKLAAPAADPIGEAAAAAAKELRKAMPRCFPSEGDALAFAAGLPFAAERAAAVRESDKRLALDADRMKIGREFWKLIERAAMAAGLGGDAGAIKRLTDMALL